MPATISSQAFPVMMCFIFFLGACVGSFLNVCIWRIPRGESINHPGSHCPNCDHAIKFYDNIPLISWLVLNGKCRNCSVPITSRYFFVELLTAVLFTVAGFKVMIDHQPLATLLLYFPVIMLLVTTTFIDIEHRIIPNKTTFPLMGWGIIISLMFPEIWQPSAHMGTLFPTFTTTHPHLGAAIQSIGGGAISILGLQLFAVIGHKLFKKDIMGMGDVKYLGAIGASLGFFGSFFTLFFGALLGSIGGLLLKLHKKEDGGTPIPFGPYLALGTYIWMIFGLRILIWYFSLFLHKGV
jgi:leader peptidase (prepilin peptidase)/N-methyltransferase